MADEWKKVKFASDCVPCECCEEPWCQECEEHYSECSCIGPAQAEYYETKEVDGELYVNVAKPVD